MQEAFTRAWEGGRRHSPGVGILLLVLVLVVVTMPVWLFLMWVY